MKRKSQLQHIAELVTNYNTAVMVTLHTRC